MPQNPNNNCISNKNHLPMPPKRSAPAGAKKSSTVTVKKATPMKGAPQKVAPKKAAPKKVSPKKAAPKKVSPKKAAPKKVTPKKAAPKKVTPKKAAPKKVAPKKAAPKKVAPKKAAPKKAVPKKAAKKGASPTGKQKLPSTVSASGVASSAKQGGSSPSVPNVAKPQSILQKGRGVVDVHSGKVNTCHVYETPQEVYQCTLNQTNISSNNNKFYILQILEEDCQSKYYFFTRWGRVGVPGQTNIEPYSSVQGAIKAFEKKFHDKTLNEWSKRNNFQKVQGRYYLMDIDYSADKDNEKAEEKETKKEAKSAAPPPSSTLPKSLQDLMRLIGSRDMMMQTMRELDIDVKRMPLGKISKGQIQKAYGILKEIEAGLGKPRFDLEGKSALFYTLIPHNFGFSRPPMIASLDMLKKKMELLETLGELEIAARILDTAPAEAQHPLDKAYEGLRCKLRQLPRDHADFQRIVEYARNTQGKTHTSCRVEVDEVFAIEREGESALFDKFASLGNRQMLWHGSRLTNYMGILSQGLRIAPPEAPCTGYMFGKGIYLADVCSKSANYCFASRSHDTGLMLLCEAALGKQKEYTSAKYMEKAENGFSSSKGIGRMLPDPKGAEVVDGVLWPKGRMLEDNSTQTSLIYPEHIIYNVGQCRMRFLVQMKFTFI